MAREEECICCAEVAEVVYKNQEAVEIEDLAEAPRCITNHPDFAALCLNCWVLQAAWLQFKQ